ncbi:hypothetical protein tinsulaeT_13120 [Thalassotalea insulae]|uniref:Outer membrane protein OmpA-like transmembrane domain-containing protein n=1 Tax=Thalassotalea insulae TaxID=2056778 RepID=A0ABQ6GTI8_9GAMM|nr:outer membrane beta-barrel protein [Thalassotalea insulae]GLX77972.1 hypothetical protein tinsulaeT_13120 [Thalassotalea insulae]
MQKTALSLLLLSASVTATEDDALVVYQVSPSAEQFYLGGYLGKSSFDVEQVDLEISNDAAIDDSDSAYKLIVGYSFNPHFAIEGGYANLGEVTANLSGAYVDEYYSSHYEVNAAVEVSGLILNLVGIMPVNEQVALYAKLGVFSWDADLKYNLSASDVYDGQRYSYSDGDSESVDDKDAFYGVGMSYQWNNWSLRGEYEIYKSDSEDIDVMSVGVTYHF